MTQVPQPTKKYVTRAELDTLTISMTALAWFEAQKRALKAVREHPELSGAYCEIDGELYYVQR
jgi:hypothetical protein